MHIFKNKFKHSLHFQAFPEPYSSDNLHILYRQNDRLTFVTSDPMLYAVNSLNDVLRWEFNRMVTYLRYTKKLHVSKGFIICK